MIDTGEETRAVHATHSKERGVPRHFVWLWSTKERSTRLVRMKRIDADGRKGLYSRYENAQASHHPPRYFLSLSDRSFLCSFRPENRNRRRGGIGKFAFPTDAWLVRFHRNENCRLYDPGAGREIVEFRNGSTFRVYLLFTWFPVVG